MATHFSSLPDLAVRSLGGSVLWANDELFAERENLIKPEPAEYRPATFGHKGQVYDGWETRRRRDDDDPATVGSGNDAAIIRLGAPGIISGVVVDTAWFKGYYPPEISVEAAAVQGYPSTAALVNDTAWTTILDRSPCEGDTKNPFAVASQQRWTHVRLSIYPDGGVARFRVHGRGVPDPQFIGSGPFDLAALENGGVISACSNMFYGSPNNLLLPGTARSMGEGWETSRRRDAGNDWVQVLLSGRGTVHLAELDTSYFLGNSPGAATLRGRDGDGDWFEILPRTALRADTRHRFILDGAQPITEVRMDVFPDGGMARLRLFGALG